MRTGKRLAAMAMWAGAALLAACGNSSSDGPASLRMVNASSGYPSLDLSIDAVSANKAVTLGSVGTYVNAATSGVSTVVSNTGSTAALSTASRTLTKDVKYTLVAYGSSGALKTALIQENVAAPAANVTSLQILNLAPDAGAVDVYLTGSTDSLDSASANASGLGSGSTLTYTSVTSGTYRLRVTGAGDKTDLRLDAQGLVLASTQVASLIIAASPGGVLVNGVLVVQQGAATLLANSQARVRVVASVSGNASVTAVVGGTNLANAVASPNIGSYTRVLGSTGAPATVVVNNVPVAVANLAVLAGGDYTLLVWGDAANPQTSLILDDNRYPTVAGNAKIRLLNGLTGRATALTLKADFTVVAQSVDIGQVSAFANVASSTTMRLDISSPTTSVVQTLTGVTVTAKGLYTMYVLGDATQATLPAADFRKER